MPLKSASSFQHSKRTGACSINIRGEGKKFDDEILRMTRIGYRSGHPSRTRTMVTESCGRNYAIPHFRVSSEFPNDEKHEKNRRKSVGWKSDNVGSATLSRCAAPTNSTSGFTLSVYSYGGVSKAKQSSTSRRRIPRRDVIVPQPRPVYSLLRQTRVQVRGKGRW